MLGTSGAPVNGSQCVPTPGVVCGATWIPSLDRPTWGLGRRNAVTSAAFISSTLSESALSSGLFVSNLVFTCSQVRLCCAWQNAAARKSTTAATGADLVGNNCFISILYAVF